MKYLQMHDIIDYFAKSFRKIFAQNTIWVNEDNEVVELTEGNTPQVYDHLPREPENYPYISIEGGPGAGDPWAINDRVDNLWISERFGSQPLSYEILGNGYKRAFGIQLNEDLKLRDVGIALKYASRLNGDITLNLSSASASFPGVAIASGTIDAFEDTDFVWKWCELYPQITLLQNQLYFLTLEAPSDCIYYVAKDTNPDATLTPYPYLATKYGSGAWSLSSSSTLFAVVQGPVYIRLGGGIKSNLIFRIEAKDIHSMRSVKNIVFMYLNALKHADLKRKEAITYPPTLNVDFDFMSETTEVGVKIINISESAESVRERGNDRIFSVLYTVEVYGFWQEDFRADTVKKVVPDIKSFDP